MRRKAKVDPHPPRYAARVSSFCHGIYPRLNPEKRKKALKEINHTKEIIIPPYGEVDRTQIVEYFSCCFFLLPKTFSVIFYQKYFLLLQEILWSVSLPRVSQGLGEMVEAAGVRAQHFNICRRAQKLLPTKYQKYSNHKMPKNVYPQNIKKIISI